jgi:hypothetical protein
MCNCKTSLPYPDGTCDRCGREWLSAPTKEVLRERKEGVMRKTAEVVGLKADTSRWLIDRFLDRIKELEAKVEEIDALRAKVELLEECNAAWEADKLPNCEVCPKLEKIMNTIYKWQKANDIEEALIVADELEKIAEEYREGR